MLKTTLEAFVDFLGEEFAQEKKARDLEIMALRADVARLRADVAALRAAPLGDVERMIGRPEQRLLEAIGREPPRHAATADPRVNGDRARPAEVEHETRAHPSGTCIFRAKSAGDSAMKSATDSDLISAIPI
jgi:hypothetical protein